MSSGWGSICAVGGDGGGEAEKAADYQDRERVSIAMIPACFGLLLMRKAPEQLEGHSRSGFCLKGHMWIIVLHFLSWQENRIAVLFVIGGQKVLPLSCTRSQIFDIIYKREILEKLHFGTSQKDYSFLACHPLSWQARDLGGAAQPLCRLTNLPHFHPQL